MYIFKIRSWTNHTHKQQLKLHMYALQMKTKGTTANAAQGSKSIILVTTWTVPVLAVAQADHIRFKLY